MGWKTNQSTHCILRARIVSALPHPSSSYLRSTVDPTPAFPKTNLCPIFPADSPERDTVSILEKGPRIHPIQENLLFAALGHF